MSSELHSDVISSCEDFYFVWFITDKQYPAFIYDEIVLTNDHCTEGKQ